MPRRPSRPLLLAALFALVACGLAAATAWALPASTSSTLDLLVAGTPLGAGAGNTLEARWFDRAASRLQLTETQRDEIRSLASSYGPEIVQTIRRVKQSRVELFEAVHEHPPFESEIRGASARLAEAQTDLALLRANLADDVHGVLTPAQQEELEEMKQNLRTLLEMAADGFIERLAAWLSA